MQRCRSDSSSLSLRPVRVPGFRFFCGENTTKQIQSPQAASNMRGALGALLTENPSVTNTPERKEKTTMVTRSLTHRGAKQSVPGPDAGRQKGREKQGTLVDTKYENISQDAKKQFLRKQNSTCMQPTVKLFLKFNGRYPHQPCPAVLPLSL